MKLQAGQKIKTERQPIYASNDVPSYKITERTVESVKTRTDYHGHEFQLVRFKGYKKSLRLDGDTLENDTLKLIIVE